MTDTVKQLQAWMELTNAKARYCRTLDTKDWDGFSDLFVDDFEQDLSGTSDMGVIRGRDTVIKMIRSSIETAITCHQVHTPEITLNEAGDEAEVIWPMSDRVIKPGTDFSLSGYGHYNERWVKQNGEWKMAYQKLTRLHMEFHEVTRSE